MQAWQITKKDLKLLVRDRRALVVLVVLPIAFIGILGLSTGRMLGWTKGNQLIKVSIVDVANSTSSKQLLQRIQQRDVLNLIDAKSEQHAEELLENRGCTVIVIIGEGFDQRVDEVKIRDVLSPETGRLADGVAILDVRIKSRGTASTAGIIVEQLVFADAIQTLMPILIRKNPLARRLIGRDLPKPGEALPTKVKSEPATEQLSAGSAVYQQLVPSYTVMFAFFLVNIMARSFIAERELGTLRRLRTAPISPLQLMIGKTVPFLMISLLQSAALFIAGRLLFGMSWGQQPWLLIPVIVSTSAAATSLGLLIAASVRTDSQVSAYANFLVITMAGISGCFMPRDWLPDLMQQISLGTPHAWSLIAYEQILSVSAPNQAAIMQSCAALMVFAAAFFVIGLSRYRVRELAS